jgi:hypothetical protein
MKHFLIILSFSGMLIPQKGSAPSGFYPGNYNGDTFTGTVMRVEADSLTLEYRSGANGEVFSGTIERPCMAPSKSDPHQARELHLSAIPLGSVLTVFYNNVRTKEPDGSKHQKNLILALRFDEVNGQRLNNPNRPVIMCSDPKGGLSVH